MGGRQSRFSRLQPQGEGPEEHGGETSGSNREYLNYEQLKVLFEKHPNKMAKVHIALEEPGQPLQDVILDTTLRGLFYNATESGGDANLATYFLLEKEDERAEDLTYSGFLSPIVIPYTKLWVSERQSKPGYYDMQFRANDAPATMYFRNKPGTDLWAIYTKRPKDEETRDTEGGEAEGEEAEKTEEEEKKKKKVSLMPERIDGVPPRTNTIQARDHDEDYVYNVKFWPVTDKAKRQSTKAPAAEASPDPKTSTTPKEPEEEEEEKESGQEPVEEKETGENETETLQPRDGPKEEVED